MPPTISAFEKSPDEGRGLARDMRVRWALEEVGQPYDVRLLSFEEMKEPAHLALHPFGQIPTYEDGELALFDQGRSSSISPSTTRACCRMRQVRERARSPGCSPRSTLSDAQIAAMLKDLHRTPLGIRAERDFRISVAGAQEKTALLFHDGQWVEPTGTTPTTHILKPAIGTLPNGMDLTDSIENEHFCLRLMASFGLKVAHTEIASFAGTRALIIERFDRLRADDGRLIRLPQEDCCQALSVPPTRKYQSEGGPGTVEICELLQGSDEPLRDRADFLKANVLFWLIGATDGHAKNFSIALTPGGRFTMTPLYDVLTVQPSLDAGQLQIKDMKLAMRVGKGRHFVETGLAAGFSREQVAQVFEDIKARANRRSMRPWRTCRQASLVGCATPSGKGSSRGYRGS